MTESLGWLAIVVLVACAKSAAPTFSGDGEAAAISEACQLVSRRCSRCHPLDRVLQARVAAPQWPDYVHRMRLMPGSGIPPAEEQILIQCLSFRSASDSGVSILAREAGR